MIDRKAKKIVFYKSREFSISAFFGKLIKTLAILGESASFSFNQKPPYQYIDSAKT